MPARAAESGGVEGVDGVRKRVAFEDVGEEGKKKINSCNNQSDCCSDGSSSTSIGRNSDASQNSVEESGDGDEVQSLLKCPFDAAMEALEEVLPIRRGISRFYNGKSKSFASLAEASSSSIKDLGKPDNAYMRRRRNLTSDKNRSSCLRSNGGGISKRASKPTSATIAAEQCRSRLASSWRSFSLADLQHCVSVAECGNSDRLATKPCS